VPGCVPVAPKDSTRSSRLSDGATVSGPAPGRLGPSVGVRGMVSRAPGAMLDAKAKDHPNPPARGPCMGPESESGSPASPSRRLGVRPGP
jgi:hypothetical protein